MEGSSKREHIHISWLERAAATHGASRRREVEASIRNTNPYLQKTEDEKEPAAGWKPTLTLPVRERESNLRENAQIAHLTRTVPLYSAPQTFLCNFSEFIPPDAGLLECA